jgi:hypothetical protein
MKVMPSVVQPHHAGGASLGLFVFQRSDPEVFVGLTGFFVSRHLFGTGLILLSVVGSLYPFFVTNQLKPLCR